MLLLAGISLWPPIFIRLISFGLCLWFIWLTLRSLKKNGADTDAAMRLRCLDQIFNKLTRSPRIRQNGRTFRQRLSAMLSLRPFGVPFP